MKKKTRILFLMIIFSNLLFVLTTNTNNTNALKEPINNNSSGFRAYSFAVSYMYTDVTIKKDGSIDIFYTINFTNFIFGDTIDIVDIGFPNKHYKLRSVQAWIDGYEITDIRKSEYISIGVEVHLGSHSILPGESAILEVKGNNPKMVFKDDTKENFASCVFRQTWFSSQFAFGETERRVRFYFPEDLTNINEVEKRVADYSINFSRASNYVEFSKSSTPFDDDFYVGIGIPSKYVDKMYSEFWVYRFGELVSQVLFFLLFFGFFAFFCYGFCILPIKERKRYLPPTIKSTGGAVRMGLKTSEAAIILEKPLTLVASLVIYEMMSEGLISVKQKDPLRFKVEISSKEKSNLPTYQKHIINGIKKREKSDLKWERGSVSGARPHDPFDQDYIRKALLSLIKETTKKMKGFNLKKTKKYYNELIERAWIDMKEERPELENAFLWIMMDENYDDKMEKYY
ncbi:MAG: hypothetical protein ACTSXD_13575, partial [Candidatus Heimdallarchaeaceae archaeon]